MVCYRANFTFHLLQATRAVFCTVLQDNCLTSILPFCNNSWTYKHERWLSKMTAGRWWQHDISCAYTAIIITDSRKSRHVYLTHQQLLRISRHMGVCSTNRWYTVRRMSEVHHTLTQNTTPIITITTAHTSADIQCEAVAQQIQTSSQQWHKVQHKLILKRNICNLRNKHQGWPHRRPLGCK
jgi:hypothetical protein